MVKAYILAALGATATACGAASAQFSPYAPTTDAEMMEAFVTCSVVWDVATAVAVRAEQDAEAPFFRERAEESRIAAASLGQAQAEAMLEDVRDTVLRDMKQQALSDPRSFMNGPYQACASLAGRTAEVAGDAGKTGATGLLIR